MNLTQYILIMESVKSIGKSMMYGISKVQTNVEFTFSNNKGYGNYVIALVIYPQMW